jgi:hypothetical protein
MAFAVGILVGLITLFILFVWSRKGGLRRLNKRAVLIAGPSDAGKTLLFSQLAHGKVGNHNCTPIFNNKSNFENILNIFVIFIINCYSQLKRLRQ